MRRSPRDATAVSPFGFVSRHSLASAALAGLGFALALQSAASGANLVLQLTPGGYDSTTGVLTPDVSSVSGLTAGAEGTPTVSPNATPSGKPAFNFDGSSAFDFTAQGPYSQNTTLFAVLAPNALVANNTAGGSAIAGGPAQFSLDYRLNSLYQQNILLNQRADQGHSTSIVPTSTFSVIEVVYNQDANTSTFYLNGALDPSTGQANNDGLGLTRFGAAQFGNSGSTDYFNGQIAAFYQYDDALSAADSATINAQLISTYITPAPEPASLGMMTLAAVGLLGRRSSKRRTR